MGRNDSGGGGVWHCGTIPFGRKRENSRTRKAAPRTQKLGSSSSMGGRRAFIAWAPSYQDTRLVLLLYAGGGGGSLWSWFEFPHVGKKNKKKTVQSAMIRSLLEAKGGASFDRQQTQIAQIALNEASRESRRQSEGDQFSGFVRGLTFSLAPLSSSSFKFFFTLLSLSLSRP